jgi:O-antigen ligase
MAMSWVLLLFYSWVLFKKQTLDLPSGHLWIALAGFYLINSFSISRAFTSADAIYESQRVFLAIACILYFLGVMRSSNTEQLLVKSVLVIAVLYAGDTISQMVRLPDLKNENMYLVKSFAGHRNLLGSFLFLMTGFALYGIFLFKGRWRLFSGLTGLVLMSLILLLQVRSVYLAVLSTTVVFIIFGTGMLRHYKKAITGIMILFATVVMVAFFNREVLTQLNPGKYAESFSGLERLKIWGKTLQVISENPLLGVGAGNWQYNFTKFGTGDIDMVKWYGISFQRPHNDFLWILSETGLTGLLLIVFTIIMTGRRCYFEIRRHHHPGLLIFSAFLTGLMVDAFFSFDKERITHIVMASLMFAIVLRHANLREPAVQRKSNIITIIIILLLIFNLVISIFRIRGEYHTQQLLGYQARYDARKVVVHGQLAISPFYKADPTSTPVYSYIGWGYNALNRPDSMLMASEKAYQIAPYDHEVLSNYGLALERLGRREEARRVLTEALRIQPYFEATIFNLVVLEYNSGNYREAYNLLLTIPGYEEKHAGIADKIRGKAMQE